MVIKKLSLEAVQIEGHIMEMGVFKGNTINYLASLVPDKIIHGFDSFEGLPEKWSSGHSGANYSVFWDKHSFNTDMPIVLENVQLHKGFFEESLPVWREAFSGPISFIHIDCDLYSSTKTTLDMLADRMIPGTVLLFDEFFGYFEWKDGEYKAFMEFVAKYNVEYEYLYYTHENVTIRIISINNNSKLGE